jgi:hypothetical protein
LSASRQGFDFVGYRFEGGRRRVRRKSFRALTMGSRRMANGTVQTVPLVAM